MVIFPRVVYLIPMRIKLLRQMVYVETVGNKKCVLINSMFADIVNLFVQLINKNR